MISGLPIINQQLLKVIFRVMYLVSLNSEVNRMDVGNVCKVICPNLTYPNIPKDPLETMTDINKVNDTLTFYVSNYPSIYEYGHNLFDDETLIQNVCYFSFPSFFPLHILYILLLYILST